MPVDPALVGHDQLDELVRNAIAEVLMVPPAAVRPESALIAELGAESIDFLDLIFRIEDGLRKRIPMARWERFIRERRGAQDVARTLTAAVVLEFARREQGAP